MIGRSIFAFGASVFIAAVALAGCGGSTTGSDLMSSGGAAGNSSGGAAGNSSGGAAGNSSGGAGGGQACGGETCKAGQQCCGAPYCELCVPAGEPCPLNCPPPPPPNDGGPPVPCGPVNCPAGEMCCDASCGACSGPGGACPGVPVCSDCNPQDVLGVGTCPTKLGYAWDGMNCNPITGCSCQGNDCYNMYPDLGSCYTAHQACMPAGA